MRKTSLIFIGLFITFSAIWCALAFFYAGPSDLFLQIGIVVFYLGFAVFTLTSIVRQRQIWRSCLIYFSLFILMLAWYFTLKPSNDRQWQPDVAILSKVSIKDNLITVHDVRNFDYRSETDYSPAYYDKVYDLNKLKSADIIVVYWMGPLIAHTFVSFDFGENDHLAISIEARKELGEEFSTIKGFFRQYELYYVVADERDVIRLRTNYRHNPNEDVFIYRISATISNIRAVFMQYVNEINSLNKVPKFYNSLTTNCTTGIWKASQVNKPQIPFSWKILANGYLPEYLYENNLLETRGLSFQALSQSAYVNEKAHQLPNNSDFSTKIRELSTTNK